MTGAEIIDKVVAYLTKYVVFVNESQPFALALWVIHTYALGAAEATPYPLITSPEKRSGKTRLLEALQLVVARPWLVSGVSEAVLFRKIEKDAPTLLLDELDAVFGTYAEKTEPIRAVINAGNRRTGFVARCVGRNHDVADFGVFCPKCLAGLDTGKLPETIRDRSIPIGLHRKADEPLEPFRPKRAGPEADSIVTAVKQWVEERLEELGRAEPELPDELNDRAAEGWEPLLAIADALGTPVGERARGVAVALSGDTDVEDESYGVQILRDLRETWNGLELSEDDQLKSELLYKALRAMEDRPWGGWGKHRAEPGLDARDLARLLKPYGIRPRTLRFGGHTAKGYKREQFADAWQRYVPDEDEE